MHLSRRRFIATSGIACSILAGCSDASDDTQADTRTQTPTSAATDTPASNSTASPNQNARDGEITVQGSEWTLVPEAFEAILGQELTVHFENIGEVTHNLTVGEFPADERPVAEQDEEGTFMTKTDTIQPGETTSVTFTPESTGTFPYWCDVPGHRDAGMVGEMTVIE